MASDEIRILALERVDAEVLLKLPKDCRGRIVEGLLNWLAGTETESERLTDPVEIGVFELLKTKRNEELERKAKISRMRSEIGKRGGLASAEKRNSKKQAKASKSKQNGFACVCLDSEGAKSDEVHDGQGVCDKETEETEVGQKWVKNGSKMGQIQAKASKSKQNGFGSNVALEDTFQAKASKTKQNGFACVCLDSEGAKSDEVHDGQGVCDKETEETEGGVKSKKGQKRAKKGHIYIYNNIESNNNNKYIRPFEEKKSEKDLEEKPKGNSATEREQEEFDIFWRSYPRKTKKKDARRAWTQMKKIRPELEKLLKSLEGYKRSESWQKENGRYVMYPATWLRGEMWAELPNGGLQEPVYSKPAGTGWRGTAVPRRELEQKRAPTMRELYGDEKKIKK